MISQLSRSLFLVTLVILIPMACGTNPVTGQRELILLSQDQEIEIGNNNYVPTQQSQGGPYVADPKLTPYVDAIGKKLANQSNRSNLPYEFVVLNNPIPNAWALPGGKIAINTGLLIELNNEAELAAVIGHEIIHAAARHGAKSMERGILTQASVLGLGIALGEKENANLIVGAATLGAGLINQKYGRDAESESDLYGMEIMVKAGYNPIAAVSLQETFVRLSKDKKKPNWLQGLFASHPPSQDRVDANRQTAARLGAKGFLGEKEFQEKIAHLKKAQPAYKHYAEAQQALKEDKLEQAHELIDKARQIEPNEALFDGLKGNIFYKQKDYQKAEAEFSSAIKKNGQYFLFHLERGLSREQLKQFDAAQKDLEKSIALLPTAPAHNSLGDIAKQSGDTKKAKQHYKLASGSKSLAGELAATSYATLDMPENPHLYIKATPGVTRVGSIAVILINESPVTVEYIKVDVAILNARGGIQHAETYTVKGKLAPGEKKTIESRLFLQGKQQTASARAKVTYARVVDK